MKKVFQIVFVLLVIKRFCFESNILSNIICITLANRHYNASVIIFFFLFFDATFVCCHYYFFFFDATSSLCIADIFSCTIMLILCNSLLQERPPPVPPSRSYTISGNQKLGYPQTRTMKMPLTGEQRFSTVNFLSCASVLGFWLIINVAVTEGELLYYFHCADVYGQSSSRFLGLIRIEKDTCNIVPVLAFFRKDAYFFFFF